MASTITQIVGAASSQVANIRPQAATDNVARLPTQTQVAEVTKIAADKVTISKNKNPAGKENNAVAKDKRTERNASSKENSAKSRAAPNEEEKEDNSDTPSQIDITA